MTLTIQDEQTMRQIVKEEVKDQLTDFRSNMVSRLDTILKVTTDTQQELIALSHQSVEHTNKLERHEKHLQQLDLQASVV